MGARPVPFGVRRPAWAPRRWSRLLAAPSALGGGAVLAVVLAWLAVNAGTYALVAALSAAAGAVCLAGPRVGVVMAVLTLVWTPHYIFGGALSSYPEAQKGLMLLAAAAIILYRGLNRIAVAPLVAYATVTVTSILGGTVVTGLGAGQVVSSLITLTVGWLLFAVRWDWDRDKVVVRVLAAAPLISVIVGLGLDVTGIWSVLQSSPPRLSGAMIPAFMAAVSLGGLAACLVLFKRDAWRWTVPLGVANAAMLCATLTRGAMLAATIALLPAAWRLLRRSLVLSRPRDGLAAVVVIVALAGGALLVAPQIAQRDDRTVYVEGRGVVRDPTSGRLTAWTQTYREAQVNLVFGRGIGAGPTLGAKQEFFLAQHNEYLRMLLETGFFGAVTLVLVLAGSLRAVIRRAPTSTRADLGALAVGVAVYSFTDNTLTSVQISVPVLLVIAIGAAPRLAGRRA